MRGLLSVTFLCWTALASPVRVIDGDTFVADIRIWPKLTVRDAVRVGRVNTPERGQPNYDVATHYVREWVDGEELKLTVCGEDKYGRTLASEVVRTRDWANLADDLLRYNLAVPYP